MKKLWLVLLTLVVLGGGVTAYFALQAKPEQASNDAKTSVVTSSKKESSMSSVSTESSTAASSSDATSESEKEEQGNLTGIPNQYTSDIDQVNGEPITDENIAMARQTLTNNGIQNGGMSDDMIKAWIKQSADEHRDIAEIVKEWLAKNG